MANDLVVLENQLKPLAPRFAQVLPASITPDRLIRTVVISAERLPQLLDCDRQSLFNAAMSAACLGLEVDGVTGQAYLIPFKGRAQLVVGYKGYNTLAARSGLTITGEVVRDGDAFDFDEGEGWIKHKKLLGKTDRRIIGAWAKASAVNRPAVVKVMSIDELMAVKAKSPGAKRSDSPWNDTAIGFPAMCEKTVKRRLARSMPLNVMQLAARLDEAVDEQGQHAQITPDRGLIIDGEFTEASHASPTPTADDLIGSQRPQSPRAPAAEPAPSLTGSPASGAGSIPDVADYWERWDDILRGTDGAVIASTWNADKPLHKQIQWTSEYAYDFLRARVTKRVNELKQPAQAD